MSDLKLRAEVLRIGILGGYIAPQVAISWADAAIAAAVTATLDLIEVSLSRSDNEIVSALGRVAGTSNDHELRSAVLRSMAESVFLRPEVSRNVARTMYQMALAGDAPTREDELAMLLFDDAYDLAEANVFGTPAGVDAELREYLSRWR